MPGLLSIEVERTQPIVPVSLVLVYGYDQKSRRPVVRHPNLVQPFGSTDFLPEL